MIRHAQKCKQSSHTSATTCYTYLSGASPDIEPQSSFVTSTLFCYEASQRSWRRILPKRAGWGEAWVTSAPQHMVLLSVATVQKSNPYTGGRGSKDFQKMGTRRWQGTQRPPGTHFCWRMSRLQGHGAARGNNLIKHPNDPIWNGTHDLPAYSGVLESNVLLRAPFIIRIAYLFFPTRAAQLSRDVA